LELELRLLRPLLEPLQVLELKQLLLPVRELLQVR